MRLTIIIKVINIDLLKRSLNNLKNQSISEKLEIIFINENYDDTSKLVEEFSDKFYKISNIENNVDNTLYSSLLEATGEYVLITDSNQLSNKDYLDNDVLKNLYETASAKDSDILIYNINKEQTCKKDYDFIEFNKEVSLDYKNLNIEQIKALSNLDCDMLFSNKFKLFDLEYKDINQLNTLKLKTLQKSHKIYILNDFSKTKKCNEKLFLENETLSLEESINKENLVGNINHDSLTIQPQSEDYDPIISIIIPVYNPLMKDILRSFYSILNQSFDFKNLEVLFINDCSKYLHGINTIKEIIKKYPNTHLYNTPINSGLAIARNIGLDNAKGKYIMFLDSDCYFSIDACKILYDSIVEYNVDIVSGNYYKINNNKRTIGWNINGNEESLILFEDINQKSKIMPFNPSIQSKIFKKEFLDKNNLRFYNFRINEDKLFMFNALFTDSNIIFINKQVLTIEESETLKHNTDSEINIYKLKDLLIVLEEHYYIYELFMIHAKKYSYIILNDVDNLTLNILRNSSLNFEEFKIFCYKALDYYTNYLENPKTKKYTKIQKFINYLINLDFLNAYKEYRQLKSPNISSNLSNKIISIIVDVYDKDLLEKGLDNLFKQFPYTLEIICIKCCNNNLSNIIKKYQPNFYNIKIIDKKEGMYFDKKITEANGDLILLTNLYYIISNDFENLNKILDDSSIKDYEITLFNLERFRNEKYNKVLEKLAPNILNSDDLTIEELYILYKNKCNILLSNSFILKTENNKIKQLAFDPISYIDLLVKSKHIYLPEKLPNENNTLEKLILHKNTLLNDDEKTMDKIKSIREDRIPKIPIDQIIIHDHNISTENLSPKISIIIPVYNPENKHIQIALNSIFNQTFDFNDLEIIFVNDQSNKKTGIDLIKQYTLEYPNIHLYHTPVNSGAGIARNIGLDNAKGQYIMFLDHDDYYLSNACETLYDTIENEDAQLVIGNYIQASANYKRLDWNQREIYDYKTVAKNIYEKYKFLKITHGVWIIIYRKEYLYKHNIRFKSYKVSEDTLFNNTCILKDNKIVAVNEPIIIYELRQSTKEEEGSKTLETSLENLLTRFIARYEICEMYENYAPEYKYIILNDVSYITKILLNYRLNFKDFKKFIDTSSKFYADYLNNQKTLLFPKINNLCEYIAKKDYNKAYREYIKLLSYSSLES